MRSTQDILNDLDDMLRNFNGREYSGPMTLETRFFADLGMVSIEAVVLGEMLENHYRIKFPFNQFMSDLTDKGAQDVTLGDLVEFLNKHVK